MAKVPTQKQNEIVQSRGKFAVKACPGSGKTFTAAAFLANRLSKWEFSHQGIATISFTNVAWQEIKKYLTEDFNKSILSYPHFLGTIDSFINQYIFLPFGHLVMGCKDRPRLIGPPINNWDPIGKRIDWSWRRGDFYKYSLNDFSYTSQGGFNHPFLDVSKRLDLLAKVKQLKKSINSAGLATQSDANYFALKLLEKYPQLAAALSYRFPLIIVDEAQDTTLLQMQIIDFFLHTGLENILLVGDPDQAIYEWNKAKPELFKSKFELWKTNSIELNENWRSSQKICNFTFTLSSLPSPSTASNDSVKNCDLSPEIWTYSSEQQIDQVISRFIHLCKSNSIEVTPRTVAVVTRSSSLLNRILGGPAEKLNEPWANHYSKEIAQGAFLFQSAQYQQGFSVFERGALRGIFGDKILSASERDNTISKYGFVSWRKKLYILISQLPVGDNIYLDEWVERVNEILKGEEFFGKKLQLALKGGKNRKKYAALNLQQVFSASESQVASKDFRIGTVHSIKGETFEALLLILRAQTTNKLKYRDLLTSGSVESNEELRVVYVALTRPRRFLVIAVPELDKEIWTKKTHKSNAN